MSTADPSLTYLPPEEDMINHYGVPNSTWLKMLRPELGYTIAPRFKYQMGGLNQNMYLDLLRPNRDFYDQNNGTLVQQPPHYLEGPMLSRENSYLGKRKLSVGFGSSIQGYSENERELLHQRMLETDSQQSLYPYPSPLVATLEQLVSNPTDFNGTNVYPRIRAQSEDSVAVPPNPAVIPAGPQQRPQGEAWEPTDAAGRPPASPAQLSHTDQEFQLQSPGYSFPQSPNRSEF